MIKRVTFDFETRAFIELKKVGAFKYSRHPLTQPTCLAIKVRGEKRVYFLDFEMINRQWDYLPKEFRVLWVGWIEGGYEFTGHNAFFERCIYRNILVARYGWPEIPLEKYRCTAAKAAACALPRSLEGAGEALALSIQKDKRGYNAMMATCKPTKQWNAWTKARAEIAAGKRVGKKKQELAQRPEPPLFLEPDAAPDVWQTLYTYCKIDVRTEELLDETLPDLIPLEQEIWHLNQKLNWRGLRCDLPTVRKVVGMIQVDGAKKRQDLDRLTAGLITKPRALKSIMEFLALEGVELPNLQAKTIEDALNGFGLSGDMRALLEITKALSLSSTKKFFTFLDRSDEDGWIRDIVLYHAASTGRDGGTGLNAYNFPKGLIKMAKNRPYATVNNVANEDHETLRMLYGDSLGLVFSAILRNMIIPAEGCEFFVADFSKIEVAVLWWCADHEEGLNLLRGGLDVYREQAATNLGVTYSEIPEDGDDRQLGKAQILGCGFRMSWKRFKETAWNLYRLKLTSRQSVAAVKSYRERHKPVVELWDAYENAAVAAVETGEVQEAGKCKFFTKDKFSTKGAIVPW